ncbi:MAG: hypothetical protein LBV69_02180, partial [Bacteroidales bacterium]|nr:hypothetical protein [Bacteroidales bacterium]
SDFFYLQYKQENNTVYYAKTKEIKELANFVGIPISIKYLAHSRRFFGINTLLNFDTYFKIYSKYNIQFANANMYSSEKDIIDSFKKPINLIYANFSPSVMFRIGKEDFVHGNIEFKFPVIPMTTANNFFLASSINLGFFISGSIIIPIKSKK